MKKIPALSPRLALYLCCAIVVPIVATAMSFHWSLSIMLLALMLILATLAIHAFSPSSAPGPATNASLRHITFAGAAFLSLVLTVLIPPMQVPDENAHLLRAAALADGQILLLRHTEEFPGTQTADVSLIEYSSQWLKVADRTVDGASRELYERTFPLRWAEEDTKVFTSAAPYYPMLYAPAAAGLAAGRALDQPIGISITWARIAMWAFGMLILFIALRIAQAGIHTLCATIVLPMTLQQAASINLDAITIPAAFLIIAMISQGWYCGAAMRETGGTPRSARAAAWAILILLCLAKPVFLTLFAPIGWQILEKRRYVLALPVLATIAVVIAWQAHVAGHFVDVRISLESPPARILGLFRDPMPFLNLLIRSFEAYGGFYLESMIGRLGWLDIRLPAGTITMGLTLLMAAFVADGLEKNTLSAPARAMFALTIIAYAMGSIVLLWAAWTPPGSLLLFGVQGRYFVPMLPAIAMILGTRAGTGRPALIASRVFTGLLVLHLAILCVDMPHAMIQRYWL